jgi:hypothetical protein
MWPTLIAFLLLPVTSFYFQPVGFYEAEGDLALADSSFNLELNPAAPGEVVTVYVLVVADEEYRNMIGNWKHDAVLTVEKADDALYREFGINLVVAGFLEWESRNGVHDGVVLLEEVQVQSGWRANKGDMDIMVAFTNQGLGEYAGFAEFYSGSPEADTVLIMHQFDFGRGDKDWHVLQSEVSHIFGAPDHVDPRDPAYWKEDTMSYLWLYYTDKWCEHCREIIMNNRGRFT